ncbi:ABC transporter permease [Klebsiella pneumoniae]|uniref:ABC transporter permease n=1 Tax=Klebsiella pneumoniae TaxID=573 RepID=A0A377V3Z4_KLEPN|nr:ABC transporter permease [Klebsiella pneumoniae]
MVLLATTAWSLSAVDVALVLGPGNPPTLAVLAWQWLSQGDELQQAKGALASLLLMASLGGLALVAWSGWRLQRQYQPDLHGVRHPHPHALPGRLLAALLPLSGLLGALLLAGLARSAPPQMDALGNSLGLALAACALGAAVCLLWLACGPARGDGWSGYRWSCRPCRWPTASTGWRCMPGLTVTGGPSCGPSAVGGALDAVYFAPGLAPARSAADGCRPHARLGIHAYFLVADPAFANSPTADRPGGGLLSEHRAVSANAMAGAGRIPTLTSQAVALSSGGEAQTLAAQALWQLLLPAVCFTLTALLAWLAGRYRRGLR